MGCSVIEYLSHGDAEHAIKALDGVDMRGSVVRVTENTAPAGQTWADPVRVLPPIVMSEWVLCVGACIADFSLALGMQYSVPHRPEGSATTTAVAMAVTVATEATATAGETAATVADASARAARRDDATTGTTATGATTAAMTTGTDAPARAGGSGPGRRPSMAGTAAAALDECSG